MHFTIRPMEQSELPLIRDSWTRSMDPEANDRRQCTGQYIARAGQTRIIGWAWYEMHRAWVRAQLEQAHVIVATLPDHDEALGWCCFVPPSMHGLVVHYVYTIPDARRRGVGAALLASVLAMRDSRPPRYSHMTSTFAVMIDRAAPRLAVAQ